MIQQMVNRYTFQETGILILSLLCDIWGGLKSCNQLCYSCSLLYLLVHIRSLDPKHLPPPVFQALVLEVPVVSSEVKLNINEVE